MLQSRVANEKARCLGIDMHKFSGSKYLYYKTTPIVYSKMTGYAGRMNNYKYNDLTCFERNLKSRCTHHQLVLEDKEFWVFFDPEETKTTIL